jgi:hypothetical protein
VPIDPFAKREVHRQVGIGQRRHHARRSKQDRQQPELE